MLIAAYPEFELRSLLGANPPEDIEARLEAVVGEYLPQIIGNEVALRTALRLALDPAGTNRDQLLMRQGRVIGWLKDALEPLRGRLPDPAIERLVFAIRATTGIEALVLAVRYRPAIARRRQGTHDVVGSRTASVSSHRSEWEPHGTGR